jgi:biopolymer transport protein ExbD
MLTATAGAVVRFGQDGGSVHSSRDPRGMITEINVTPMVDIMLVLLIIFMVTATYITRKSIDVQLPEGATGRDQSASSLSVVVAPGGKLMLQGEEVSMEDLRQRVPGLLQTNPEAEVLVDGDRQVEYGRVMEVIDALRGLGVKNFAASVEHVAGAAPAPGGP